MTRPRYLRLGPHCKTLKSLIMSCLRLWHLSTKTMSNPADDRDGRHLWTPAKKVHDF